MDTPPGARSAVSSSLSLGAAVPPLESPPWFLRAGRCPRSLLRPAAPRAPFRSWRGRKNPVAGARLPVALGARRLQPGREQWSRSWCPGGGAGGGLPSAARGLQTLRPPSPEASGGASRLLQTRLHGPAETLAPRRARLQHGYGALCGAPHGPERKVLGLCCFSSCGARSRPGRRGRRNALGRVSVPSGRGRPAPGTARGSSARCSWTGAGAPARRRPLPAGEIGRAHV